MDIQIGNPQNFSLLWLLAVLALVVFVSTLLRSRALKRFATANLLDQLISPKLLRGQWLRSVSTLLAMALMIVAMVDLRWGKAWREVPQRGIEVMFVLDVSRSMLAEDVVPNRLLRAKQQITDMLDEMAGDRVGLIVFAGEPRQRTPLTRHHRDFKRTLAEAGPQHVERGGSRLGDAIALAAESFLGKTNDHKAIVVLTDGEDQESEPVKVAKQAHNDNGIRIFTVGLGDFEQGSRIPVNRPDSTTRRFVEHEGRQVWSKLNGEILSEVAMVTDGAYIPAGTKQVDMADVYHRYVARVGAQDFENARINSYIPRFQYFVAGALVLLITPLLLDLISHRTNTSNLTPETNGQT